MPNRGQYNSFGDWVPEGLTIDRPVYYWAAGEYKALDPKQVNPFGKLDPGQDPARRTELFWDPQGKHPLFTHNYGGKLNNRVWIPREAYPDLQEEDQPETYASGLLKQIADEGGKMFATPEEKAAAEKSVWEGSLAQKIGETLMKGVNAVDTPVHLTAEALRVDRPGGGIGGALQRGIEGKSPSIAEAAIERFGGRSVAGNMAIGLVGTVGDIALSPWNYLLGGIGHGRILTEPMIKAGAARSVESVLGGVLGQAERKTLARTLFESWNKPGFYQDAVGRGEVRTIQNYERVAKEQLMRWGMPEDVAGPKASEVVRHLQWNLKENVLRFGVRRVGKYVPESQETQIRGGRYPQARPTTPTQDAAYQDVANAYGASEGTATPRSRARQMPTGYETARWEDVLPPDRPLDLTPQTPASVIEHHLNQMRDVLQRLPETPETARHRAHLQEQIDSWAAELERHRAGPGPSATMQPELPGVAEPAVAAEAPVRPVETPRLPEQATPAPVPETPPQAAVEPPAAPPVERPPVPDTPPGPEIPEMPSWPRTNPSGKEVAESVNDALSREQLLHGRRASTTQAMDTEEKRLGHSVDQVRQLYLTDMKKLVGEMTPLEREELVPFLRAMGGSQGTGTHTLRTAWGTHAVGDIISFDPLQKIKFAMTRADEFRPVDLSRFVTAEGNVDVKALREAGFKKTAHAFESTDREIALHKAFIDEDVISGAEGELPLNSKGYPSLQTMLSELQASGVSTGYVRSLRDIYGRQVALEPGPVGRATGSAQHYQQAALDPTFMDDIVRAAEEGRKPTKGVSSVTSFSSEASAMTSVYADYSALKIAKNFGIDTSLMTAEQKALRASEGWGPMPFLEGTDSGDLWVPQKMREAVAREVILPERLTNYAHIYNSMLAAQSYSALAAIFTGPFVVRKIISEPIDYMMSVPKGTPKAIGRLIQGYAAGTRIGLETAAQRWDRLPPRTVIESVRDLTTRKFLDVARAITPNMPAEKVAMYQAELLEQGVGKSGAFGGIDEARRIASASEFSPETIDLIHKAGMTAEQARSLMFKLVVGVENVSRAAGYVALREEGYSPHKAFEATTRGWLQYYPQAMFEWQAKFLSKVAWFTSWPIGRLRQTPYQLAAHPEYAYWTWRMYEGQQSALHGNQNPSQGRMTKEGDFTRDWDIIAGFSKTPTMGPDWTPQPWEAMPAEARPTPNILRSYPYGQILYVRSPNTPLEMIGRSVKGIENTVEEATGMVNPIIKSGERLIQGSAKAIESALVGQYGMAASELGKGAAEAVKGIPPFSAMSRETKTPYTRYRDKAERAQELAQAQGLTARPLSPMDRMSEDLTKQQEAIDAAMHHMTLAKAVPVDLSRASDADLLALMELSKARNGAGPIPYGVLLKEYKQRTHVRPPRPTIHR